MIRTLALICAAALLATAPPAQAEPTPTGPPTASVSAARVRPAGSMITAVDARITDLTGRVKVQAKARIAATRMRDRSAGKQADRIKVHTVVSTANGPVVGPEHTLDLDGRSRIGQGSRIRLNQRTGTLTASIALTKDQRRALKALRRAGASRAATARAVRVLVRQHQDTSAKRRGWESIGSAGARARYRGPALKAPARVELMGSPGTVIVMNSTGSPLVLLAGPTSCMYDSIYDDAEVSGSDAGSQLGTLNGLILDPGTSVQVPVISDHNSLNGQEDNDGGQQVLADYTAYQNYAMHDAATAGEGDLPEWELPEPDNEDNPDEELATEVVEFTVDTVRNLLNATGQWMRLLSWARDAEELTEAELEAFEAGVETFDVGLDVALGPVLGIVTGLMDLFLNSCESHDGYMAVGATDQYHPWRQFAQVYDWGKASPTIPNSKGSNYGSLSNGLKVSASSGLPFATPLAGNVPLVAGGTSVFDFRTAPVAAQSPATATLDPGTRRVHCTLPDSGPLNSALAATGAPGYQPFAPVPQWYDWSGASTPMANGLIGDHFIPASKPSSSVRTSSDGHTWTPYDIPPGQDWVDLPLVDIPWVGCDVQAPEIFPAATGTSQLLLAGTRVPSSVIAGPDYVANELTITSVTPMTADPFGGDPMTITGTGFRPGATVTFNDDPLGALPATTAYTSSQGLAVTIPAGLIDSTATITVRNPDGKSVTWPGQFLYQCPRTGCRTS